MIQDKRGAMMKRIGAILMTVAVAGALLAVPLGVSAATAAQTETTTGANSSIAPGERLAGTVGVQQAAVDGNLSERTYEVRLRNADSDEQRADIVADRRDEIERRLSEHRAELDELRAARDAGNISEGTYRARVATVAAEKSGTERSAAQAGATARQLPDAVLNERDISVTALDELRTDASELGGPETAEIAREIGGRNGNGAAAGGGTVANGGAAAGDRPGGVPDERPAGDEPDSEDRPGASTVDDTGETISEGNANGDRAASDTGAPSDDGSPSDERTSSNNGASTGDRSPSDSQTNNPERGTDRDSQQNGGNRDGPNSDSPSSDSPNSDNPNSDNPNSDSPNSDSQSAGN